MSDSATAVATVNTAWAVASERTNAIPLIATEQSGFAAAIAPFGEHAQRWCAANEFAGEAGRFVVVPATDGSAAAVLVGCRRDDGIFALASLPLRLPIGDYALVPGGIGIDPAMLALAGAGGYQFARYRVTRRAPARLVVDAKTAEHVSPLIAEIFRVRDLVNTPTEDMGPEQLADQVRQLALQHDADYREWVGDDLLTGNFPTIHAVGRASHRAPRLAQLSHGPSGAPHLVLIGKGVCFDTGGLDLKTGDGMRWMKKDMGGAAHAIALAALVLQAKLPVRLTLLIPAVENAVAGNAYRPGEVIRTRAGITVEIDNTDAEGRLVLCDALTLASELKPDLILDFATLTGAARIALGPELPALFANRDELANDLLASAQQMQDPLWRLPLWRPYLTMLDSHIADLANSGASRHAGSITAALYLERFVAADQAWCHLDVYSWNDADKPGHPRGGEAQGLRAYFEFLKRRYATN